ncbi:craniofacial development protein 2-like [Montipora foliosa]|uniref:craniofacial development protein 2-like n=1 Tax=Montipora foliosa TaxID=591990 RepID=UPI0035F1CE3B
MSIQENRFHHPDTEIQYKTSSGYQLITISAWKNDQGSTIGGVGLLLSPRASENLLKVEKISPRIMRADFGGNPKSTVIACYNPTNVSTEADVTQFYHQLKDTTDVLPAHNVLTVSGDFNAQVGPDDSTFTYNPATNRNGEILVDYAEEFQLMFANTNLMKQAVKLWTFQHPSESRSQIDYILIRKKWRNSIINCQAYSSFSSIGSDHRIVSCTTCLSLRSSKRPDTNPMKTID